MSQQDDHSAAKRRQIIKGAELVFTDSGYEGASMSRIAAEAGVSKGTLYNYFDSKAALFAVFVEQKVGSSLNHIFQSVAEEEDMHAALRKIAHRMLEMTLSDDTLLLYRIVVSEAAKFPHLAQVYWQNGPCRAVTYMTNWIELQVSAGHLVVGDPTFAAEQFLALCQARLASRRRLQILRETSNEEIEDVVRGALHLFLAGYGVDSLARGQPRS